MFGIRLGRELREFVFVFAGMQIGGNAARQFCSVISCCGRGLNLISADRNSIFWVRLEALVFGKKSDE